MIRPTNAMLVVSLILFLLFVGNLSLGAARLPTLLSDVAEVLLLFASCLFFVLAALRSEARNKRR